MRSNRTQIIPTKSWEQKVFKDNEVVCFCFNYTKKDIVDDFFNNNYYSKILEKIKTEKQNQRCECASKNPKGI